MWPHSGIWRNIAFGISLCSLCLGKEIMHHLFHSQRPATETKTKTHHCKLIVYNLIIFSPYNQCFLLHLQKADQIIPNGDWSITVVQVLLYTYIPDLSTDVVASACHKINSCISPPRQETV